MCLEGRKGFDEWLPEVAQHSTTLTNAETDHGVQHWKRVLVNARKLATEETDMQVVELFCVFHDSMRQNEYEDRDHGARGYVLARELGATDELTGEQRGLLRIACVLHDSGATHPDPTVGVCWDADRLDLPRVGIVPDPRYFSTPVGKELATTEALT